MLPPKTDSFQGHSITAQNPQCLESLNQEISNDPNRDDTNSSCQKKTINVSKQKCDKNVRRK